MEIYRDSTGEVTFEHPYGGLTHVEVYDDYALMLNSTTAPLATVPLANPANYTGGIWSFNLDWSLTQYDRELRLRWKDDTTFVRETQVSVVTPVASTKAIGGLAPYQQGEAPNGPADLVEVESKIRQAITSYTGRKFGYFVGDKQVYGRGESFLRLPERLVRFDSITTSSGPIPPNLSINGDGWYLTGPDYTVLETKQAPPEEFQQFNQVAVNGVVYVPAWYGNFAGNVSYTITGAWGYLNVPDPVREAALLLAADYANLDESYRDRYLTNVSATDWTLEYNPMYWQGTGNARADALLDAYRANRMEII